MSKKNHLYTILGMLGLAMATTLLSAICVLAASSIRITRPANNSTVPLGSVDIWTAFDQPSSFTASEIAREYEPITYRIYKGGVLQTEQQVYQAQLNFTSAGSYSTTFTFNTAGTYTIQASVPRTPNEWGSVTFTVSESSGSPSGSDESENTDYSDSSINSQNAAILSEGKPQQCTLTAANNFMAAYKVIPSESGSYVFFASGSKNKVKIKLYESVGNTDDLDSVEYEEDNEGCAFFLTSMTAGTTYTFLVQSTVEKKNTFFDVGFVSKSSGKKLGSAAEITLNGAGTYSFGVFSGSQIPDSEWVISDRSVVDSFSSSSFSVGKPSYDGYYCNYTIKLEPQKNGTATVTLVDSNTRTVYASCKVTCKGFVETTNTSGNKDNQSGSSESGNAGSNGSNSSGNTSGTTKTNSGSGTDSVSSKTTTKQAVKLTAKAKTFKKKTKTKKYTVVLKDAKGKAIKKMKLTLKVNKKTYTAKTNSKGKATFKITKLNKKGRYTAVVKFAGNKNYKKATKKVKITVK